MYSRRNEPGQQANNALSDTLTFSGQGDFLTTKEQVKRPYVDPVVTVSPTRGYCVREEKSLAVDDTEVTTPVARVASTLGRVAQLFAFCLVWCRSYSGVSGIKSVYH